ncbi:acyl-CoA dehydrogenase [Rhizoctonia solani AG-1 IA]|uniref:Acyl-CoA dehydrogenase n=1 Tax=Thanatephorus cucumeris (strain AG1-IA) TaxID=983506 RepID=L8WKS6_THACA|nr:acyl-CoA dehydrogenase [Rhizoctonia solani AG-1 IA]
MSTKEMKVLTREEVAKHNKEGDLWIIVDSVVFDLSKFAAMHPGGLSVLLDEEIAGQDATEAFFSLHRQEVLAKPQYQRLQIGTIHGESKQIKALAIGELSQVPYAEPSWLSSGFHSNHREFQKAVRKFVDEYVIADGQAREEDGKRISQSVLDKMAEIEMHAMRLGPGKHLKGRTLMGGIVKPEQFDYFHELIVTQELTRVGARGYGDGKPKSTRDKLSANYFEGLLGGMVIGLPPVLNFAKPALRDKIVPDIFAGKKFISLAISEAFAGSDVAGLRCTAVKSADGSHWTINGTKKWITNATFSDYFTVGCKTEKGLTVFLVPRGEGVETKPIKTSYSPTAGTGYITFDNVKVPSENMLGPENGGLLVILSNFNHERWVMCCASARSQRLIVEECLKWANQRKVFGKPLISQAVIRHKLAAMIARVESGQNWLENVTYQMCNMDYKQQSANLAGQIAFLKMYLTRSAQETATDATQIFGGRAITKTGMGRMIEHYHRTVPFDSLLGGAEDVLGDLGVRQAIRKMPKNARL